MADTYYHSPDGPAAAKGDSTCRRYGSESVLLDSSYGKRKFMYLYNAHTASRAAGVPCFFSQTNTTYPGLAVTQAVTNNLYLFAGIHVETVTTGAWGWVQVGGYYSTTVSVRIAADLAAGGSLKGADQVDYLVLNQAIGTNPALAGYAINIASLASSTNSTCALSVTGIHIKGVFS